MKKILVFVCFLLDAVQLAILTQSAAILLIPPPRQRRESSR